MVLTTVEPHLDLSVTTMRANTFHSPGSFNVEWKAIPVAQIGEAIIKVSLTTICGTDIHIVKGEYPVRPGLTIGHEVVGTVHELGLGVTGFHVGQRVVVGAITPCGQCEPCLAGHRSQCGGALGGWRLGNTIDGVQAEYVRIPYAQANLCPIPDNVSDEQVLLLSDIASTGFSAAESGGVKLGDMVAVFAQGPIGLCATLGARLMGASHIFAVDTDPFRLQMARHFGASGTLLANEDPVGEIMRMTEGRGVDVAIEALGTQATFENCLKVLTPAGTLSSVGVYSGHLRVPGENFGAGLSDIKIVTTLCPGGRERMHRLMRLVEAHRIDLTPLFTHSFTLDQIKEAYEVFGSRRERVLKVAIRP
ncbi:MAG TPA: alcohol dehydrogenase catalytic domain-containing protein [Bryobacteraceae bacterium]|jgi:threonine dehydrogenase-like Zn-dependent dehydrogenase|nr:alcohol dehydrogenase catalytic domain-containing protein [Bryobacteraceae bacterium]